MYDELRRAWRQHGIPAMLGRNKEAHLQQVHWDSL